MFKKKIIIMGVFLCFLLISTSYAGNGVFLCLKIFNNTSCEPSNYVEKYVKLAARGDIDFPTTHYVSVAESSGILNFQPAISSGIFDLKYRFSNDGTHWDDWVTAATGLISSSPKTRYLLDPNGAAAWLQIRLQETGGTGQPVVSGSLCSY